MSQLSDLAARFVAAQSALATRLAELTGEVAKLEAQLAVANDAAGVAALQDAAAKLEALAAPPPAPAPAPAPVEPAPVPAQPGT